MKPGFVICAVILVSVHSVGSIIQQNGEVQRLVSRFSAEQTLVAHSARQKLSSATEGHARKKRDVSIDQRCLDQQQQFDNKTEGFFNKVWC